VQCVTDDMFYFGVFGQLVAALRKQRPVRVEQLVTHSLNVAECQSPAAFLAGRWALNVLLTRKWIRLYRSFCDAVAYRSVSVKPFADTIDLYRAWQCWRALSDRSALMSLVIDGIAVGDLVNDSFLRFRPAATIDLRDGYLWIALWQAHRDVRRARHYFSGTRPKIYLCSYSTYIQHGIAARTALHYGVQVFSFGNYQEFSKALALEDWMHTRNADEYAADFARLPDRDAKLALARSALEQRLAGVIDGATAYMRKSAYAEASEAPPDLRGAAVVFLHDFYDSPHVYRDMVFPDFWEWICFTVEALTHARIPFYIKPHPNQISLNDAVLGKLRRRYPHARLLTAAMNNKQLAAAGMACAVTVYGTVAHEMAYLGVPSVACARHPHISFDFCRTARDAQEYAQLLRSSVDESCDRQRMRDQSLMFYFMHNLSLDPDRKALNDAAFRLRRDCNTYEQSGNPLLVDLDELQKLRGFDVEVQRLAQLL
jgi:hypothetical protein